MKFDMPKYQHLFNTDELRLFNRCWKRGLRLDFKPYSGVYFKGLLFSNPERKNEFSVRVIEEYSSRKGCVVFYIFINENGTWVDYTGPNAVQNVVAKYLHI